MLMVSTSITKMPIIIMYIIPICSMAIQLSGQIDLFSGVICNCSNAITGIVPTMEIVYGIDDNQ